MSNEVAQNFKPGQTLYSCRFQLNGNVFLTSGASDEVWGAGGNDADDYDVEMTEIGNSGHYVGDFDPSGNIAEGFYRVAIYHQKGGSPADTDQPAIAQGVGRWDGTAFIPCAIEQDVLDAHVTTDALIVSSHGTTDALIISSAAGIEALITSSHAITDALIAALSTDAQRVKNVYGVDEPTAEGVTPESPL